jgi:hypothetical protein
MVDVTGKGNNPELWSKLLNDLDEKLQLGLLDKLRRCRAYHFESETLIIEAGTEADEAYLRKAAVSQQLEVLVQEATGATEVKVKGRGEHPH